LLQTEPQARGKGCKWAHAPSRSTQPAAAAARAALPQSKESASHIYIRTISVAHGVSPRQRQTFVGNLSKLKSFFNLKFFFFFSLAHPARRHFSSSCSADNWRARAARSAPRPARAGMLSSCSLAACQRKTLRPRHQTLAESGTRATRSKETETQPNN
jgi:hypothetical protein